jgi:hypothetical protein
LSHERFEVVDSPDAPAELVSTRYRHTALFGKRVRWLPPHRLVPSFASADGHTAVYRRRSQLLLTESSENSGLGEPTSFVAGPDGLKVRIDEFGYARVIRPARSQQRVDPLTHLADGAHALEREAAESVCRYLNQHVEALGEPHRWTPPPTVQLVPLATRPYSEPPPTAPRPGGTAISAAVAINAYLDARAAWLKRRFAWENGQRAVKELADRAAGGDPAAMRAHLVGCLQDVLWPAPVFLSYGIVDAEEIRFDVREPGLDALPDREATVATGHRVVVKPMADVRRVLLHNRHAFGLVVRLLGESFAALPSVQRVVASAFQSPAGVRPRYILSAMAERRVWTALYGEHWASDEPPERILKPLGARYELTALGSFLPIEPFG